MLLGLDGKYWSAMGGRIGSLNSTAVTAPVPTARHHHERTIIMDALTPHPDCDAMCAAIAAAGQEAANPDAKNRQALFERAIRDVLDLRAHAMEIHFRQARNPEARRKAHRTRKCAERRVGELLIAAERAGLRYIRQKTKKIGAPTDLITLEKLGITRKQSQDWQGLARKSESEFEAWLEAELAKKSQRRSRRRNAHAQPAAAGALVPIRPGIQLPGRVTRTGWKLPKDMSFEDWLTCGQVLDLAEDAVQWWRGDWWAFGSGRQWGEGPELAEKADINYQTIRDYGWVAGAFKDLSRRRDNLTFEHHRVVASLDVADQEKWLDLAESGGWSRAELRRELRYATKVSLHCSTRRRRRLRRHRRSRSPRLRPRAKSRCGQTTMPRQRWNWHRNQMPMSCHPLPPLSLYRHLIVPRPTTSTSSPTCPSI